MAREELVLDNECYRDYFLAMFSHVDRTPFKGFELYDGHPLDRRGIIKLLKKYTIVTFNGNAYDVPLLALALSRGDISNDELKNASDHIIQGNLRPWQFEDYYGVKISSHIDHIDLIEVAPGQASLKIYGGRLHAPLMQDLPYHFNDNIFPDEPESECGTAEFHKKRSVVYNYCGNDLATTKLLRAKLLKQIDLRRLMSEQYGIDLRSKSDAQIAEAVIKSGVEALRGGRVYRPKDTLNISFRYLPPKFIKFATHEMKKVLRTIENSLFVVNQGKVEMPAEIEKLRITIGGSTYKLGIGGLHSTESKVSHHADAEYLLCDRDVASYYPSIILLCQLFPKHLGREFLAVYRDIYDRRLAAKKAGDSVVADALKIVLNGSFGKFGSMWSILFSPNLLIQTTITGQLALLMLIEMLEEDDIAVVSANTDGVVIKCHHDKESAMNRHVAAWELRTQFVMENTNYRALYSRDVNNYIAIKPNGDAKLKGAYAAPGLQKNPTAQICVDAVVALLTKGIPLEETLEWCDDITKFVSIKRVDGGGQQQGVEYEVDDWVEVEDRVWQRQAHIDAGIARFERRKSRPKPVMAGDEFTYLGKAVRFYYSKRSPGPITYVKNGNRVGKSEGAMALMNLPEHLPTDIDYQWYLNESMTILRDIDAAEYL